MRSPIDVLMGRVGGFTKMEVARRTVPCCKHVVEKDAELALCMLVDSGRLYAIPTRMEGITSLTSRRGTCVARWSTSGFASSSPDCAAMSKEPTKPSERWSGAACGKARAQGGARTNANRARGRARIDGGPDPRVRDLTAEVERLRYQLAQSRAEAGNLREERDELRQGVEQALEKIARQ